MKNAVILLLFMLLCADVSFGQVQKQKGVKKEQNKKLRKDPPKGKKVEKSSTDKNTIQLVSASTNAAKARAHLSVPIRITDATVNYLNMRTNGTLFPLNGSGIVGMPKVTYGIANGKLLLRTTDAPTIGSSTGPGSVGTGTSLGTMGTSGNGLGVNGKNPYAGPNIYGIRPYGNFLSAPTGRTLPTGIKRKD